MENLKKLRTERKLSQQKLAEKFRLSQQSIYKYESGLAQPDIQTLKNFASYFHTTIDYLVGYSSDQGLESQNTIQKLSQEENTIINLYRCLSPSMRKHLEAILTQLAKTEQES